MLIRNMMERLWHCQRGSVLFLTYRKNAENLISTCQHLIFSFFWD